MWLVWAAARLWERLDASVTVVYVEGAAVVMPQGYRHMADPCSKTLCLYVILAYVFFFYGVYASCVLRLVDPFGFRSNHAL